MSRRVHWEQVYRDKAPDAVSWFQARPILSLELIAASGIRKDAAIIDVGGGTSMLVDCLLDSGHTRLAVLDLSAAALAASRARLGDRASQVEWHEADVTAFEPPRRYALWHDRALFHFLTDAEDRRRYVATLRKSLEPGGTAVIAGFALDGPPKCSGLNVRRFDDRMLAEELGAGFELRETRHEIHRTPWQSEQCFVYCRLQRL